MKKNNLETRTMTVFAGGQLYKNILAPKNLSKTIVVSNEVLPTLGEEKIDFKNSILKPFKNLFGKAGNNPLTPALSPKARECKRAAFTLAETMTVLVVLGVVAAITVPALVNRHVEAERRTKLKKAMSAYDLAINKMVVKNGIKSNDTFYSTTQNSGAFAVQNNCTNTSSYFKIAQTLSDDNGTNCRFKTSDGLYWDISNITKPIVAVKEEFLNTETADGNTNNAFYLRAWFDANGSLRVNDLTAIENYAQASESDKEDLEKLYDFIAGKKASPDITEKEPYSYTDEWEKFQSGEFDKECVNPEETVQSNYDTSTCTNCKGCTITKYVEGDTEHRYSPYKGVYDSKGNILSAGNGRPTVRYVYDDNEKLYATGTIGTCQGITKEICLQYGGNSGSCRYDESAELPWSCSCLAKGTMITLTDGSTKAIQDIDFVDELKVWDFDNGCLSSAKPLWIKVAEITDRYNLLTFSDGRTLKTINQHRIFNKEAGKYTYPMTDDTPIGTTTLLDDGSEVTLVKKEVIEEPVEFYNIMTEYHFNCFANGISTSNRFNNLYPIKDYKFVKEERELVSYDEYKQIPYEWYEKMRLAEQPRDVNRDGADSHADSIANHILNVYIAKNKRQMANV